MKRWYINPNPGEVAGPYSADDIRAFLKKGEIRHTDLICLEGTNDWKIAYDFPEFDRRLFQRNRNVVQAKWFVVMEGRKQGPFKTDLIKQYLKEKKLKQSSQIHIEENDQWVPLGSIALFNNKHSLEHIHIPEQTKLNHVSGNKIDDDGPRPLINDSFLELANTIQEKNTPNYEEQNLDDFEVTAEENNFFKYFTYATFVFIAIFAFSYFKKQNQIAENQAKVADVKPITQPIQTNTKSENKPKTNNTSKNGQDTKPKIVAKPSPQNQAERNPAKSTADERNDDSYRRYDPGEAEEEIRANRRKVNKVRRSIAGEARKKKDTEPEDFETPAPEEEDSYNPEEPEESEEPELNEEY